MRVSTEKRKDLIFYICFMAIPVIQFVLFYIIVNFQSILLAFRTSDQLNSTGTIWNGLDTIKETFTDYIVPADFMKALRNSLVLFLIKIGVGTPLGLLFSYYIYKKSLMSGFFRVVLFIPSVVSAITMVIMFRNFGDYVLSDIFNLELRIFVDAERIFPMVVFYAIFISFGTTVLLYVDAMNGIGEEIVEAAELDGATGLKEFIFITLPMSYKTIVTFILINIAVFFTDQANLFSFFQHNVNAEHQTVGYSLYKLTWDATRGSSFKYYHNLSAMGVVFSVITIPITLLVRYLLNKFGPSED